MLLIHDMLLTHTESDKEVRLDTSGYTLEELYNNVKLVEIDNDKEYAYNRDLLTELEENDIARIIDEEFIIYIQNMPSGDY